MDCIAFGKTVACSAPRFSQPVCNAPQSIYCEANGPKNNVWSDECPDKDEGECLRLGRGEACHPAEVYVIATV